MVSDNTFTEIQKHLKMNLAILEKGGTRFEVPVDCDAAVRFKEGDESIDIKEIIINEQIFSDCQRGELASETRMQALFDTTDPFEVAKIIVRDGRIQLTQEHRDRVRETKRKKIVNEIASKAINPQTSLPHPPERIKLAMDEAKLHINEFQSVDRQIKDIVKKIQSILPISFETVVYRFTIPGDFVGKAQQPARQFGNIIEEEYSANGEWIFTTKVEGIQGKQLIDAINSLTHGKADIQKV